MTVLVTVLAWLAPVVEPGQAATYLYSTPRTQGVSITWQPPPK